MLPTACPRCDGPIDSDDRFCRRCGAALGARVQPPGNKRSDWSESRAVVLLMLFAALGPLALPMLWRSRSFTVGAKLGLTVAVIAATALAIWLLWYAITILLQSLRDLGVA